MSSAERGGRRSGPRPWTGHLGSGASCRRATLRVARDYLSEANLLRPDAHDNRCRLVHLVSPFGHTNRTSYPTISPLSSRGCDRRSAGKRKISQRHQLKTDCPRSRPGGIARSICRLDRGSLISAPRSQVLRPNAEFSVTRAGQGFREGVRAGSTARTFAALHWLDLDAAESRRDSRFPNPGVWQVRENTEVGHSGWCCQCTIRTTYPAAIFEKSGLRRSANAANASRASAVCKRSRNNPLSRLI